jgi:hypothetical protein
LTDLAVTEATDDVMMTEAVEEMTAETTDVIIKETSAEIIDVAVIEIIVLGGMTAEILMETMIGIVQNATIPTLLEELNVIDVVLQSRVVDTLVIEETLGMILAHQEGIIDEILETEITIDQSARRLLTMIGNAKNVITTIFRLEPNVIDAENQNQAEEEITETVDHVEMTGSDEIAGVVAETVDHAEMTGLEEIEVHAESVEQEATTVQVEIVVEVIEVADRVMNEGGVESEIQMLPNSVAPEANHRVMPTTEDHNPSMLVL